MSDKISEPLPPPPDGVDRSMPDGSTEDILIHVDVQNAPPDDQQLTNLADETPANLPLVEKSDDAAGSVASSDEYFSTSDRMSVGTQRPLASVDATFSEDPMDVDPPAPVSTDLMNSVNGMFRVLDLISEIGSGGLVNKIIIAQDSLKAFINELSPGAYSSLTKVDFKALDELLIKPAGLYGSKSEIVASQEPKHIISAPIDVSREAQLRDIEASFAACNDNFALETLRHPNKPNVTAVESYEVLPDKDIWANQYDLFRFSERPGERGIDVDDPRLDCAILRPMKTEHDSFLAYYLTADDASAMKFKQTRLGLAPYEVPSEPEPTVFNFVRDYETVKVEQEVPNEFMLVIEDETAPDAAIPKTKGAYYKNIERKMLLKKKRVQAYDEYQDKWEIIRMTHVEMGEEEEAERNDLLAEVENPRFLREDVDADGDVELEDAGPIVVNG